MITDDNIVVLEKNLNTKLNNLLFGVKNLLENKNLSQDYEFTNLKIYYDEFLKAKEELMKYHADQSLQNNEIEN